jgi:hypothetical protein
MKYGAMAVFGVALILLIAVSFMFPHLVFAGSYEKRVRSYHKPMNVAIIGSQ